MNLICDLKNFMIISINKTRLLIWNLKQQMFTMNNKQQPPEKFYKKKLFLEFPQVWVSF